MRSDRTSRSIEAIRAARGPSRTERLKSAGRRAVVVALVAASPASPALAAQSVKLSASFAPERLGRSTTLHLGFEVVPVGVAVPSPLTNLVLSYPRGLGIGASGLGLETCTVATLEAAGPIGCPADSLMGHGRAYAELPFGAQVVDETASVAVVRAPKREQHTAMLIYAEGNTPVDADIVFPALLTGALPPFGGDISMTVPLVPGLPEGPDVSVVRVETTIGPAGLTYYEDAHGRRVPYAPRGMLLPRHCPKGGFPFSATFSFLDGDQASTRMRVRCPAPHRLAHHSR